MMNVTIMDTAITVQSKCFICSKIFDARVLADHEKTCLLQLQDDLSCITKEIDTLLDVDSESVKSATSSGSTEINRKNVRCYICGEEFATHYISVHERQCKRKWDSGVTQNNNLKKGASLGHLPAGREMEKGKTKDPLNSEKIRKAQSVASIAHNGPKQAWNARMRDKGSREDVSTVNTKRRPTKKERPKSAYVSSMSTQNLSQDLFSGKEFGIYDDSVDREESGGFPFNHKALSMQDLSSNTMKHEETKPKTPKFIECQYCFKMFSTHSIHIHEKKCLSRRDTEKELVRPTRKPRQNGKCVSVNELHSTSDEDPWLINGQSNNPLTISLENVNILNHSGHVESSRFLLCSYCSKPFGSKSLPIHLPQCQKKFERDHADESRNGRSKQSTKRSSVGSISKKSPLKQALSTSSSHTTSSQGLNSSSNSDEKTPLKSSSVSPSVAATLTPVSSRSSVPPIKSTITPNGRGSSSIKRTSAYVACQFCNNYYGSASVKIHEIKCSAKLNKKQDGDNNVEKSSRRQLGRMFGLQR